MLIKKSVRRNDLITMMYLHGCAVIPRLHLIVCLVDSLVDRLKSGNPSLDFFFGSA